MTDDRPATKDDLAAVEKTLAIDIRDLGARIDAMGIRHEALTSKLDAYWAASDRVSRFAMALLVTAWASILGTFVTVSIRR